MRREGNLCLIKRIEGKYQGGELGFRFGEPCDVNGDGVPDLAAGQRYAALTAPEMGAVSAWSTGTGERLTHVHGQTEGGLFGHAVLSPADLDGDGLCDIVASAPHGFTERGHGEVIALRAVDGRILWKTRRAPAETFGWHLEPAGDQNGDHVIDLFVGAPGARRVYVLDGRSGDVLRTFQGDVDEPSLGWYLTPIEDLDEDGRTEVAVGAPEAPVDGAEAAGKVVLWSSTGVRLHTFSGAETLAMFGEMLVAIYGPSGARIAVSQTYLRDRTRKRPGVVQIYDAKSFALLATLQGRTPGELYGRMLARVHDWDGDGEDELAIGAPWSTRSGLERTGRVEVRSAGNGRVIASISGKSRDDWLGWHMTEHRARGLWVSSLLRDAAAKGAGAIELYVPIIRSQRSRSEGR